MAETLLVTGTTRSEIYQSLLPQIEALTETETDWVANLANVAGALRQGLGFFWVGFYLVRNGELVLGPYQGPVACTRIRKGKGVCGTAWAENRTLVVPDVEAFPGHIACSSESKSEIVVPLHNAQGEVIGVLDVDSHLAADFDETDAHYLGRLAQLITQLHARAAQA
ncbi:MAG: GAF domain-containing protein [Bacteroidia bacterium]|jgi:GAF domain-containing protein|nr:GAF domain-containing protein [Bacteroidia bacterium]